MFVIVHSDGKYVSPDGHGSYTDRLEEARTFDTLAKAEAATCVENECAVSVSSLMYSTYYCDRQSQSHPRNVRGSISIRICPTNPAVACGNAASYCRAIEEAIKARWSNFDVSVKVGQRQGDEWIELKGFHYASLSSVYECMGSVDMKPEPRKLLPVVSGHKEDNADA